jgi:hypothetical protein
MDKHTVETMLATIVDAMDPALEYELRHPDFVAEIPQSGERFDRDGLRAMQEAYPNPPKIQVRRISGEGDLWTVEAVSDYGEGAIFHAVLLLEFRDGRILREVRYYAEPFEAPAGRAQWTLPAEPARA